MAKGVYACIDGVSRNVKKIPVCIDGVSRNTKTGYACIDGVSRKFFGGGAQMSSLSLGDSVFMNVNGVRKEFLIVHKGCPFSELGSKASYSNAVGIWLLMKDIYTKMTWSSSNYDVSYANSTIHNYLNTTFLDFLDEGVSSKILQAGLPYATTSNIDLGSISAKVFLLSAYELNLQATYSPNEGGILQYFDSSRQVANVRRTAYYNGITESWWTRTHSWSGYTNVIVHGENGRPDLWGTIGTNGSSYSCGIRPAMIFPYGTLVDSNLNIIA